MNDRETQPEWPSPDPGTGDPVVDGALTGLVGLGGRPVSEHASVYESVHDALRGVLDEKNGTER